MVALAAIGTAVSACSSESDTTEQTPAAPPALMRIHEPDPALAERGLAAFANFELMQGVLPTLAMRNLYISWTEDLGSLYTYYTDADAYWQAFNTRYGTVPSPFPEAEYPAGFGLADNGMVGIDCLLCHAGQLQGETLIGLGNNRLDLRGLVEDLQRLPDAIAALKMRDLPAPYDGLVQTIPDTMVPEPYASIEIQTGAAGVNDGFGLGLLTSKEYGSPPADLETFMGYQDAPAWWTIAYKERTYSDGSGNATGIYTMMSTLLAFGLSFAEAVTYLPTFEAIRHYQCSLAAPRWADADLPAIDAPLASRGEATFSKRCANCHGSHDGSRFPNTIVTPGEIGTDALRVDNFGPTEAAWFNSFIPEAQYEMTDTDGYLAPALTSIWASAPYLHNGSVPTLRALLQPPTRPERWRRSGDVLDATNVGLEFDVVSEAPPRDTIEGRKVVDTTLVGMSNRGHDIDVPPAEIDALLEYLKTL